MSSGDEDDTGYSDYLKSRRAALEKAKNPVTRYESDSDDDFPEVTAPKKRRDDFLYESEEESFVTKVETHDQDLEQKMESVEEKYRKEVFGGGGIIHVHNNERNDALAKAMQLVSHLTESGQSPSKKKSDEKANINTDDGAAETSKGAFPVALIIVDCESRKGTTQARLRRDIPADSTFEEIRKELATTWNCHPTQVVLSHNGVNIEQKQTPIDFGFLPLQLPEQIDASKREVTWEEKEVITVDNIPDYITIKVQLKDRRKPVHIKATDETKIKDLKQRVIDWLIEEGEKKIPSIDKMKVMFDDEYLTDGDETCKAAGLEDADCIDIFY